MNTYLKTEVIAKSSPLFYMISDPFDKCCLRVSTQKHVYPSAWQDMLQTIYTRVISLSAESSAVGLDVQRAGGGQADGAEEADDRGEDGNKTGSKEAELERKDVELNGEGEQSADADLENEAVG